MTPSTKLSATDRAKRLPARALGVLGKLPAAVDRHHRAVAALAFALAIGGAALAATLPLHTEFSWLLPDHQPSVVALRALEKRQPAEGVIQVGVASEDPEATRRFAADLAARLRRDVPRAVLSDVEEGDGDIRRFAWEHRHLYASQGDLRAAIAALRDRVTRAEQAANPFLVDLDDAPAPAPADDDLGDLRRKLDDARARAFADPGYVAEEGRLRMLVLRGPFGNAEPEKAERLLHAVDRAVAALDPARYAPTLSVGYTGDPVAAAKEHDLILRDVAVTTVLCLVLVALVLLAGLRSLRAVVALCLALAVGCAVTFGLTRLTIGHLNTSTAFLGSVVAGNGINFGIILVARYLEERRRGAPHAAALAAALAATCVPTGVACLAAGCAYFSLTITSFRGFSEFGIIAGTGMICCWIASYALLPALLSWFDRRRDLAPPAPAKRRPRAPRPVRLFTTAGAAATVVVATLLGVYGAVRLARDPFEDDLRTLRSRSFAHTEAGRWMRRMDTAFGRDKSGGFYIGAARVEDVPAVVEAVRAVERDVPAAERVFGRIDALSEALPGTEPEQRDKIALLADLRRLADKIAPTLDPASPDARLLADLRPPDTLAPLTFADLPARVRRLLTERDGRVGLLLAIHPGPAFDNWSHKSIRRAVTLLRRLPLDPALAATLQISGLESIFADMMAAVETEGPRASLFALVLVLVLLAVALRPGAAFATTAFALLAGLFGMLGLMALFGVRLNFINYIAIPITVGIGVDYPFNVAARLRRAEGEGSPPGSGLRATALAVALCSATTIIGYGVLLLSDNGAIRSFGAAAVLGELTCITSALVIVPALLLARARRPARPRIAAAAG